MRSFSAIDLLTVWERGMDRPPAEKALILLRSAFPEISPVTLSGLSIGRRDLYLLKLREMTYGSQMNGLAICPQCNESAEVNFDVFDMVPETAHLPDRIAVEESNQEIYLDEAEWKIHFRLPNSNDLMSITSKGDQAQRDLLNACLLEIVHNGRLASVGDLSDDVIDEIAKQMSNSDPYINITIAMKCPSCGHEWPMVLDIVSYFMSEINNWAIRILQVVHRLASAYGWSEMDILSMSAWRRQKYLELIGNE